MSNEINLTYIAEMQAKIHDVLGPLLSDDPFAIVDFPDIKNVGDSAIWLGEIIYFKKYLNKNPAYTSKLDRHSDADLARAVPTGPIFLHGGGNFGDIWTPHQDFRELMAERWPDRRLIQLPQSLHFDSAERLEQAKVRIGKHKDFTLLVRDQFSLDLAQKHFDCRSILCPDMAFMIGATKPMSSPIFDILAMLRIDKEQVERGVDDDSIPCEDWIVEDPRPVKLAGLLGALKGLPTFSMAGIHTSKYSARAWQRFYRGVRQLSRAKVIVTDRLHVHIISTLLGKPHAVLDNSYGKIGRFRSAFPEPAGITYAASDYADAVDWAKQQL